MKLSVNIDHIATLRQARMGIEPDPLWGAKEALRAGADGITFHLREDRRHIVDEDVYNFKHDINAPLNFEGSLNPGIIDIILDIEPNETTLVPEKREEVTTEGGLNVLKAIKVLERIIPKLKDKNIIVSLFVDPDETQIKAAFDVGADAIEIHTGKYANLYMNKEEQLTELELIKNMVNYGNNLGLIVNAGHGLNYENTRAIAEITKINEINTGHSIISKSIQVGLYAAVKDMIKIIKG